MPTVIGNPAFALYYGGAIDHEGRAFVFKIQRMNASVNLV